MLDDMPPWMKTVLLVAGGIAAIATAAWVLFFGQSKPAKDFPPVDIPYTGMTRSQAQLDCERAGGLWVNGRCQMPKADVGSCASLREAYEAAVAGGDHLFASNIRAQARAAGCPWAG